MLQLRSRELAEGAIRSVSFSQDERIAIDFGADAPDEVESIMREARNLHLECSPRRSASAQCHRRSRLPSSLLAPAATSSPLSPSDNACCAMAIGCNWLPVVFRDFVESNGLEFYPLDGDPKVLIAYMVKTGGALLPSHLDEIVEDVPEKRQMLEEIIESCWGACTAADPGRQGAALFKADAIIANPPCYGHAHVAEKLRIPLHMMFTLP